MTPLTDAQRQSPEEPLLAEQLGVRITSQEREALERRAAADERPLSQYVRLVLRRHLAADQAEAA